MSPILTWRWHLLPLENPVKGETHAKDNMLYISDSIFCGHICDD